MIFMTLILLISASMYSEVVKKTKSEVSFKKFGTFSVVSIEKSAKDRKYVETDSKFKGKGIAGMAAKVFLKSGKTGEIIDLPAMTIFQIDHKKKTYRTSPIQEITDQGGSGVGPVSAGSQGEDSSQSVKITRSEFRVDDTGETKVINQFETRKFTITWITEWENIETGLKGKDRLLTDVWATPFTSELQASIDQEKEFSSAYLKKQGIEINAAQQQMLGLSWIQILGSLGEGGAGSQAESSKFSDELEKIKGYPVVVDGKYYSVREGGEEVEEEKKGGVKNMLGGLARKALKKKSKNPEEEPSFTYYTELLELNAVQLDDSVFQVPSNYKKKGK